MSKVLFNLFATAHQPVYCSRSDVPPVLLNSKFLDGDGRKVFGHGGKCCCGLHHTVIITYRTNRQSRFLLTPQITLSRQKGALCFLLRVPSSCISYGHWIGGFHGELSKWKMFDVGGGLSFSKEHYANTLNVFLPEMPKISSENDIYYTWNIVHF